MRHSALFITLWLGCGVVHGVELMTWERLPLAVPLQVGQERVVFIDQNVRVGAPRSLGDKLRIQSTGGTLYLRANAPIEPTRLQLQDVQSGELILIDIAASDPQGAAALEPIRIVKAPGKPTRYAGTVPTRQPQQMKHPADKAIAPRETPIPVSLTRYAAQNLYAPLRTVEALPGVVAMKPRRLPDLSNLLPGRPLSVTLLGAWQLDDHIVSAVRLRNLADTPLALDPRELQGDFISAAFQHADLGPARRPSDTTVVYLVTRGRDLARSLLPTLSSSEAHPSLQTLPGSADEK